MESEGSLPCLQEPITGTQPEPDKSSPRPDTQIYKINFKIILAPTRRVLK
jgi:hypothetical protein